MKMSNLRSLVVSEVRSCLRLARTWVFVGLALIFSAAVWLTRSLGHFSYSTSDPSVGLNSPRYFVGELSSQILFLFALGILFLAFDVRVRDIRERIGEVLDARPISNFELLSGRLMGIVALLSFSAVTIVFLIFGFSWVAELIDAPLSGEIEPVSVLSFLILDVIPNLILWGSLTYLLAIVVRYRIVVVVGVLAMMVGLFFLRRGLPIDFASALSLSGLGGVHPSELAPQFATMESFTMRLVLLVFSVGLLTLAASLHPRVETNRARMPQFLGGSALIALAISGILGLVQVVVSERQQFDRWVADHAQHQNHSSTDIQRISGSVNIDPNKSMELDLTLLMNSAAGDEHIDWMFTLNPGYRIREVAVDGQITNEFEFENGLLKIPKRTSSPDESHIRILAVGIPDERFAYLDSRVNPERPDSYQQAQQLFRFGQKSYIYHPRFVALMPAVHWLPSSGAAFETTEWDVRGSDFYELDIHVTVPKKWTLAGPEIHKITTQGINTLFHVNPSVPLRQVALIGAEFERLTTTVQDIHFELLFSKKHEKFVRVLENADLALNDWIEEQFTNWKRASLAYPYDTLSFVEVPASLRVFGGGWRMDSVFAQPGILLMRESGLPIARFDNFLRNNPLEVTESKEDYSKRIFTAISQFFENDREGGNPLANVSKNFLLYQTMAAGNGSIAINSFIDELATLVVAGTDKHSYFSLYAALNSSSNSSLSLDYTPPSAPTNWHEGLTGRPSVWERMAKSSLSGIDHNDDPDTVSRIVFLRTNSLANQVLDFYGIEKSGEFLAELTRRFRGRTFDKNEFFHVAQRIGLDFNEIAGDWLDGYGLPGFLVANPKSERLQDSTSGASVYQTSFDLRNDEPVPGIVTVSYMLQSQDTNATSLPAIRVEGETSVKVAFQDSDPAGFIWVAPLVSLNRGFLQIKVPELENFEPTDAPMLHPVTESDWKTSDAGVVIVDDLDEGFSFINGKDSKTESPMPGWLAFFLNEIWTFDAELDQGLPQFNFLSHDLGHWYRQESRSSYGKYRQTYAIMRGQSKETRARFEGKLPSIGRWRLEYHVPTPMLGSIMTQSSISIGVGGMGRTSSITITGPDSSESSESDISDYFIVEAKIDDTIEVVQMESTSSSRGWMEIGIFEIETPNFEVAVSSGSSDFTVADAVKWTKLEDDD